MCKEQEYKYGTLIDLRNREVLQDIRILATKLSEVVKNDSWKRAYLQLASAVDALDAMEARTEETYHEVDERNPDDIPDDPNQGDGAPGPIHPPKPGQRMYG